MTKRKRLTIRCHVRTVMEQKDLTEEKVSERTGLRLNWVNPVKNGKQLPRVDKALLLAKALGVTVEDLWSLIDAA